MFAISSRSSSKDSPVEIYNRCAMRVTFTSSPRELPGIQVAPDGQWGIHALYNFGYELHETLADGHFTVVRRARPCAGGEGEHTVKHVCVRDAEMRDDVRTEFALLNAVKHDSIIKAAALYESRFDVWMFLEECHETVGGLVQSGGPVDEPRARHLLKQLLDGVAYLHEEMQIIHCNIEPQNILLQNGHERVKISGFDLAVCACGAVSPGVERTTNPCGAPEMHYGLDFDQPVDIWSVGMCAFFMLEGELPVDVKDACTAECLSSGNRPPIKFEGLSSLMTDMISGCLVISARDRPTAKELLTLYFDAVQLEE